MKAVRIEEDVDRDVRNRSKKREINEDEWKSENKTHTHTYSRV